MNKHHLKILQSVTKVGKIDKFVIFSTWEINQCSKMNIFYFILKRLSKLAIEDCI